MRTPINPKLDAWRISRPGYETSAGEDCGAFLINTPRGVFGYIVALRVISSGSGCPSNWEHVSVSTDRRCPTWEEMAFVKDLFWAETETVVQLHPPASRYVNQHPYCLHLWRHREILFPLPPTILV